MFGREGGEQMKISLSFKCVFTFGKQAKERKGTCVLFKRISRHMSLFCPCMRKKYLWMVVSRVYVT